MLTKEELEKAAFWEQEVCLDCGAVQEGGTDEICWACGGEDLMPAERVLKVVNVVGGEG